MCAVVEKHSSQSCCSRPRAPLWVSVAAGTARGRASPFPRLLLTSSCALPARTRRRRGCREPHGPLTPLRRSAAPGSSRRPPLLSWRFPVQTGRGLPSGGNARGCCRLQSASAVNPPEVPRHRGAAESWSAPLSRGDTNHSSVSVTDPPAGH